MLFRSDFFGQDFLSNFFENQTGINTPAVNIKETDKDFMIELAAPGLVKDDFKIDVDNDVLSISCEKEKKDEDKDNNYVRREFSYCSFKRTFSLPESANVEKIKAKHKDGILTIDIPKKEEAKAKAPRQIKIS